MVLTAQVVVGHVTVAILIGVNKSEMVSNISSDAGSHSEATKVVGAEIGRSDSPWSGNQEVSGVDMQSKGGAGVNLLRSFTCVANQCWSGCRGNVLAMLQDKLKQDALNSDSFAAPMPDGSVVHLPQMPLLPFCDPIE